MARAAVAFSPAHLSGYFRRIAGTDPRSTGSEGAGVVIDEGVTAWVTRAPKTTITVNRISQKGESLERYDGSPPLEYAMERLGVRAQVVTSCTLPIGAGFGCSAAALLATLSAVSTLFDLNLSREEIAALAHETEVVHRTGLGDVAALQGGGMVCRKGAGIHADIRRIVSGDPLFALSFGPIHTPSVLASEEAMDRVAQAFPDRCPSNLREFLTFSRSFAEESGLITPRVREALDRCDRYHVPASMTMLGEGVFAIGKNAMAAFSPLGSPFTVHISRHGFSPAEVEA